MYSCPLFNSSSYFLLCSINLFICEPDGLSSPAIFAFFIKISEILVLYSSMSLRLFVPNNFSIYSSICLSNSCISAGYLPVCPSNASLISSSNSAIFFFKSSSLLLEYLNTFSPFATLVPSDFISTNPFL